MDDYYTWKEKEDDKVYEQFIKELGEKGETK